MDKKYYKFQLSFKGQLVENSVDAFNVANTILAISQSLQEIAEIKYGDDISKKIKININAFEKGSLLTDFLILANDTKETIIPLLPLANNVYKTGKEILSGYETYIKIKKILKGKPPKKIEAIGNDNIKIVASDNVVINVTYNDFKAVQSKSLAKNSAKAFQPLNEEDTLLESITLVDEGGKNILIDVDKKDSKYLESTEDLQNVPSMKFKGIVSKIDTKACSGYLNIASRRLPFNYAKNLPQEKFNILVESLRKRIKIYLVGEVTMDFENNPKSMSIEDIESDIKLLD